MPVQSKSDRFRNRSALRGIGGELCLAVILFGCGLFPRALSSAPSAQKEESDKTNWWSLQPLHSPPVPAMPQPKRTGKNAGVVSNQPASPIDAFIRAKLDEKGLAPSPQADRRTLIRRLYFDVVGLP